MVILDWHWAFSSTRLRILLQMFIRLFFTKFVIFYLLFSSKLPSLMLLYIYFSNDFHIRSDLSNPRYVRNIKNLFSKFLMPIYILFLLCPCDEEIIRWQHIFFILQKALHPLDKIVLPFHLKLL